LSLSTNTLAKVFLDKYFKEIIPEIRKSGEYIVSENDKNKLYPHLTKLNT
jgi:hypothetical protein